jgi:hypothetical protein
MISGNKEAAIFPPEILRHVVIHLLEAQCHRAVLNLALCSVQTYEITTPLLYRELVLEEKNAHCVFAGLNLHSAPPEKAPSYPLELLWPYIAIQSPLPPDDILSPMDHHCPDDISHRRKQKLLSLVRTLTIRSIPSFHLSNALSDMITVDEDVYNGPLFGNVCSIIIGSTAMWQIADWCNRHWVRPSTSLTFPPILNFLSRATSPRDLVVSYPTLTAIMKQDWHSLRRGSREVIDTAGGQRRRSFRLDSEWEFFATDGYAMSLASLSGECLLDTYTVKNVVSSVVWPFGGCKIVRIEYCRCQCGNEEGLSGSDCIDHVDEGKRVSQIVDMVRNDAQGEGYRTWTLSGVGSVAGPDDIGVKEKSVIAGILRELSEVMISTVQFI